MIQKRSGAGLSKPYCALIASTISSDKPLEPQVIASIRVETNGIAYPFTKL